MKTERATTILVMSLIILLAAALLCERITGPFDGYLAFNEGWYSMTARNYNTFSWFAPTPLAGGPIDLKVPPFFSQLLYIVYISFGSHNYEWVFRLLPVACGLTCVLMTFALGRNLYGFRGGMAAAALLAVTPVFILTSHNVQTDSMFMLCVLVGLFFFLHFRNNHNPGTLAFSAILYGAALYTKQFAAVAIAALILAEALNRRLGKRTKELSLKRIIMFTLIVIIIPGHFYLHHLIRSPHELYISQRFGAAGLAEIPDFRALLTLAAETFFGLGPMLFIIGAAALLSHIVRRRMPEPNILLPLVLYAMFFLVLHKHTYYMMAIAPFLCILAGGFLADMKWKTVAASIIIVAIAAGFIQSCMVMGALKYGYSRFNAVCDLIERRPGRNILVVDQSIMSRFGPAINYYCTNVKVENKNEWLSNTRPGLVERNYDRETLFFLDFVGDDPRLPDTPCMSTKYYMRSIMGPAFFGRLIYYIPYESGPHGRTFIPGEIHIERSPYSTALELRKAAETTSVKLTELGPDCGVFRKPPGKVPPGGNQFYFDKLFADEDKIDK